MNPVTIAAFYKFVPLKGIAKLKRALRQACVERGVKGTILLAAEGINGTIAGRSNLMDEFLDWLCDDPRFEEMAIKRSHSNQFPFYRLKVRHKKEVLSFDMSLTPDAPVGEHVEPDEWNDLIRDPEVLLLDTRNDYEVAVGTFEGALNPAIGSFQDFKSFVKQGLDPSRHPRVAMFCTGGIRCEKASAYMIQLGFEHVYQLNGGILNYLEKTQPSESLWRGECFVFDQRVSLNHDLRRGSYRLCHACQRPLSQADVESPLFEQGVCCPHCHGRLNEDKRERLAERQKQVTLARQRGEDHIGRIDPKNPGNES